MSKDYAVHPGTTMKYILMSMNKNQKWLSEEIGMSKVVISELINQKRNVTPAIALAFEKATDYPADKLLKMQAEYDLYQERIRENKNLTQKYESTNGTDDFVNNSEVKVFVKNKSTSFLAA